MNTLGSRIAVLRKKRGLTQEQLAEQMGVSAQAVSKWENDLSCPDITMLPQLADFFQVSIDELLRSEQEASKVQLLPEEARKPLDQMLFKVRIYEPEEKAGMKVNVNLPMGLVKMGMLMNMPQMISGSDALKSLDLDAILVMAESGVVGKLVEIEAEDGTRVEVYVE